MKTAEGAALGTGTRMEYEVIGGVYNLLPNEPLARDDTRSSPKSAARSTRPMNGPSRKSSTRPRRADHEIGSEETVQAFDFERPGSAPPTSPT